MAKLKRTKKAWQALAKTISFAFDLEPEKAVAYMESKGLAVTWNWTELAAAAHQTAFTVAKVSSLDILKDIKDAVEKAQREGLAFGEFKKGLQPLLEARGWWGRKEVLDPSGKRVTATLGTPWRLETIFRTNNQSAYMAGRFDEQMRTADRRPYLQYLAVGDGRTRPAHAALNGIVLRADDPFWRRHYPPNGYRCRCRVRSYSQSQLDRAGLTVESSRSGRAAAFKSDAGFDASPTQPFTPDISKYPPELQDAARKILKNRGQGGG